MTCLDMGGLQAVGRSLIPEGTIDWLVLVKFKRFSSEGSTVTEAKRKKKYIGIQQMQKNKAGAMWQVINNK